MTKRGDEQAATDALAATIAAPAANQSAALAATAALGGGHVDDVELAAFAAGTLGAAEQARVAEHVDACETCRSVAATVVSVDRAPRAIGSKLGRYELGRMLGAGQMGEIYAAHDPMLGRDIAIKVIRPRGADPERAAQRLLVEARAMAKLRHPNVVRVYDAGIDGGQVFLTMERVGTGSTLRAWLGDKPRAPGEVLATFRVIAEALAAAHDAGVIHGDVKPDNVLVDDDGRPLVADFGLARAGAAMPIAAGDGMAMLAATAPALGTVGGAVGGTPVYMAPELFDGGQPSARSDEFSFCVALEEALCGARPFEGESLSSLAAAIKRGERKPRKQVRGVGRRVWAAIDRGLAVAADQRFASLHELAVELAPRRTTWLVAAGVPVVALGAAVAVFALRGAHDSGTSESAGTANSAGANAAAANGSGTKTGANTGANGAGANPGGPNGANGAGANIGASPSGPNGANTNIGENPGGLNGAGANIGANPGGPNGANEAAGTNAGSPSGIGIAGATVPGSPCNNAGAALADVWNVKASGIADADLVHRIDARGAAWTAARIATCKATREQGTQSDALLDARMGCLDENLAGLAAVIASARAATAPRDVQHARAALVALASADTCQDVGAARARVAGPSAAKAKQVAALRAELAAAASRDAAGDRKGARDATRAIVDKARSLGYAPLLAEALLSLGHRFEMEAAGEAPLREAAQVAAAAHYDTVEAEAWTLLVYLAGYVSNRHAEAKAWDEAAHAAVARAGSPLHLRSALACNELALAISTGAYQTALARGDECLKLDRQRKARDIDIATALAGRAAALRRLGKLDDARTTYEQAVALLAKDPRAHAIVLATTQSNLGSVLEQTGKLDEAEHMLIKALETQEALLPRGDVAIGQTLDNLGALARRKKDIDGAEKWWQREVDEMEHGDRRRYIDALSNLAVVHIDRKDFDTARAELAKVITARTQLLGPKSADVAEAQLNLALVDMRTGHAAEAAKGFEAARDTFRAATGDGTAQVATAWANLGDARAQLGDTAGAEAAYKESIARFEKLPHHDAELAYARQGLADVQKH